ncbi:MAG: glycosyltransferase family 2 protein [Bryobacterales bacterium]|nr:glycosyltransferase family 2 protein [Bryobacterales bacterium]
MTVSAVVPTWNGRVRLARLLDTIRAQSHSFSEVLVIDNGSDDGSGEMAAAWGARVVRFGENRGFAPAVNAGIAGAAGDAVAILNDDVELDPDWLARLVDALEAGAWFATGKLLGPSGLIDGTFDCLSRAGCAVRIGHGAADGPEWGVRREIQLCPMTAALFRAEVFRRAGVLEARFESYLEDVEFGVRCAAAGLGGIYEPAAVARHLGSATLGRWSARTVRLLSRNQVLLLALHWPPPLLRRWWWQIATGQLLWGLVAVRRGRAWAFCQGKWEGVSAFRRWRGAGDGAALEALVRTGERSIAAAHGDDTYWKWYFRLAGEK